MAIGIITGTGAYALADLEAAEAIDVQTPYGSAQATRGRLAGSDVLHISRHGEGHVRLSNHVSHRANIWALRQLGARCVIGCTACGAVDPDVPLGSLIAFDDLHFVVNRLSDGSICTFYDTPGDRHRGHWIYGGPFCEPLRAALLDGAQRAGVRVRDGGCYGHVDGPRFNTRAEIRGLAACGVTAVSQTAGPETTLAGEAELPYTLVGFATDYANGVKPDEPTPVEELIRLLGESGRAFATLLAATLPTLEGVELEPTGVVYRFEQ